jgi:hypothetical protein
MCLPSRRKPKQVIRKHMAKSGVCYSPGRAIHFGTHCQHECILAINSRCEHHLAQFETSEEAEQVFLAAGFKRR